MRNFFRSTAIALLFIFLFSVGVHIVAAALPLIGSFPSGSVSRWKLNESSGDRADSVGSNTLTDINTVASAAGQFSENAADFERDNSERFSAADSASLSITGDMSFCVWINPESALVDTERVVSAKSLSTGDQRGFYLGIANYVGSQYEISAGTKGLFVQITNAGASNGVQKGVNLAWEVGVWHHICFSYTAAGGSVEFYLDGASQGTKTGFPTSQFDNTAPFELAAVQGIIFFDGLMQDALLWNVALTDANVTTTYDAYFAVATTPHRFVPKISF